MVVLLHGEAYRNICDHARETFPNECCGFLYGNENDKRIIMKTLEINNAKTGNQHDRFEIDAMDYQYGEEFATQNSIHFLGIYHSHPNHPALPSAYDLKRAFPYFSYIILSLDHKEVLDIRSWKLGKDHSFEEEQVHIKELQ
jgi:proteasome lid subunit RPN8/RPN11